MIEFNVSGMRISNSIDVNWTMEVLQLVFRTAHQEGAVALEQTLMVASRETVVENLCRV